jgi:hypothetical protein
MKPHIMLIIKFLIHIPEIRTPLDWINIKLLISNMKTVIKNNL